MSEEEYSDILFEGPTYALLIGISNYKKINREDYKDINEIEFNKIVQTKQIRDLNFAAKDARDFADFFSHRGVPRENIKCITDTEATLSAINDAFAELRTKCTSPGVKGTNPLVIVFFSGHAAIDDWRWHYLLPHDATKDTLYKTGFKNPDFVLWLRDLGTEKLIVLLDACHSGSFGEDGKDGSEEGSLRYKYDELGQGEAELILASCRPGEKSYEFEKPGHENGIFTGCLLDLLKLKTEHFKNAEEITTANIFEPLKEYVEKAAHPKSQTPFIVKNRGASIVLAINARARKRMIEERDRAQKRNREVLEAIEDSDLIEELSVPGLLAQYVKKNIKLTRYNKLYQMFDYFVEKWPTHGVDEICTVLDSCYSSAQASPDSPSAQMAGSNAPAAAAPVSQGDDRIEASTVSPGFSTGQGAGKPSVPEGSRETSAEAPINLVGLRAEQGENGSV